MDDSFHLIWQNQWAWKMYKVLYRIMVSNGIGEPDSEGASETPDQTFF